MFKKYKKSFLVVLSLLFMVGCSSKSAVGEYDKPALYWYKKIVKSVAQSNFDKADNYYVSLRSEHMRSPLLPTATLLLAQAHMQDKSYIMSDYYLDEYLKKYAKQGEVEHAKFLKIKAAFLGIKNINKDQKLMMDTLADVDQFITTYPRSIYRPMVDTLKVRLHMAQYMLNENIARLYERVGKDRAAKIYREKNSRSPLKSADINPPEAGFLEKLFN